MGALSWNPERIRSLAERGHELWGCWSRSMGWDQGPYPMLDDCLQRTTLDDAPRVIAEQDIECVYSLFQVYDARLWAPPADGVEQGVWSLLRSLLDERARGRIDVPFVFHWGFDVHNLDAGVVRVLDGHVFCNRELLTSWTAPAAEGGHGLDLFDDCDVVAFLDGDRPKSEFMGDDVTEPLSVRSGELHTVCAGRPFNIDTVALAQRGIHLHVYGNGFDDAAQLIARDVVRRGSARDVGVMRDYVHLHPSLQPTGASWPEVRTAKSQWVREFSRYDAGWSYVGLPDDAWKPLEERAAIPNRLSTYLLAGLPVISDRRPGLYRYDELSRLDVNIDLVDDDYDALHARLTEEATSGVKRRNALAARHNYSFDASIDELLDVLGRARARYLARPIAERRRNAASDGTPLVRLAKQGSAPTPDLARRLVAKARRETVVRYRSHRVTRLARTLLPSEPPR